MNPNKGKKSYSSFDKAFADAKAMRRNRGERFTQYKDERTNVWHVGSNVLGKRDNKIAEEDLNQTQIYKLLQDQIDDETYAQINSFESDVRTTLEEGATNTVNGGESSWILIDFALKTNTEVGIKKTGNYLVLTISNGLETINPKMGGAFIPHIPLMLKVAQKLKGKPVRWTSWNPTSSPAKWPNVDWFYTLDLNVNEDIDE